MTQLSLAKWTIRSQILPPEDQATDRVHRLHVGGEAAWSASLRYSRAHAERQREVNADTVVVLTINYAD